MSGPIQPSLGAATLAMEVPVTSHPAGRFGRLRQRLGAGGPLSTFVARGVLGSLGLRVAGVALAYLSVIVLARLLGTTGFGHYMYALAWLNVLVIPAAFGLEGVLTRELAAARALKDWPAARGLVRFSNRFVVVATIVVAGLAAGVAWSLAASPPGESVRVFWLALLSLPFFALARLRQHALQGLSHVVVGQVPETLLRPVCLVLLLGMAHLIVAERLTAEQAMLAFAAANLAAYLFGSWLFARRVPAAMRRATPAFDRRRWLGAAASMLLVGSMYVVHNQTDTLMLGWLTDADAVGLYSAANRGAAVLGFVVLAVAATFAPLFSGIHAADDRAALQRAVRQSCRWIVLLMLPGGLVLVAGAVPFLRLFGDDFVAAATALRLLCLGHLLTSVFGAVAILLIMTGHERVTGVTVGITAVLNIALNALLIPRFGIEGAAVATGVSLVAWNLALYVVAGRRLAVRCLPFGGRSRPGSDDAER